MRVNLAEIRLLFVRDMGTSVEGLQPCRSFPAEGEAVCVRARACVCVCVGDTRCTIFGVTKNLRGSQSAGIYGT